MSTLPDHDVSLSPQTHEIQTPATDVSQTQDQNNHVSDDRAVNPSIVSDDVNASVPDIVPVSEDVQTSQNIQPSSPLIQEEEPMREPEIMTPETIVLPESDIPADEIKVSPAAEENGPIVLDTLLSGLESKWMKKPASPVDDILDTSAFAPQPPTVPSFDSKRLVG